MKPLIDLTDERFGCIVVLDRAPNAPNHNNSRWRCRCDVCGNECILIGINLRSAPNRLSCPNCIGSKRMDRGHHPSFRDETDKRYATVVVVERAPNAPNGNAVWKVRCDCGNVFDIQGIQLRVAKRPCPVCRPTRPGTVQRVRSGRFLGR